MAIKLYVSNTRAIWHVRKEEKHQVLAIFWSLSETSWKEMMKLWFSMWPFKPVVNWMCMCVYIVFESCLMLLFAHHLSPRVIPLALTSPHYICPPRPPLPSSHHQSMQCRWQCVWCDMQFLLFHQTEYSQFGIFSVLLVTYWRKMTFHQNRIPRDRNKPVFTNSLSWLWWCTYSLEQKEREYFQTNYLS